MPLTPRDFSFLTTFIEKNKRLPNKIEGAVSPSDSDETTAYSFFETLTKNENKTPHDYYQILCVYKMLFLLPTTNETTRIICFQHIIGSCIAGITQQSLLKDESEIARSQKLLIQHISCYLASAFSLFELVQEIRDESIRSIKLEQNPDLGFELIKNLENVESPKLQYLFSAVFSQVGNPPDFIKAAKHFYQHVCFALDDQTSDLIQLEFIQKTFDWLYKKSSSEEVENYYALTCIKFFEKNKDCMSATDLESFKTLLEGIKTSQKDLKLKLKNVLPEITYQTAKALIQEDRKGIEGERDKQKAFLYFERAIPNYPQALLELANLPSSDANTKNQYIERYLKFPNIAFDEKMTTLKKYSCKATANLLLQEMIMAAELKAVDLTLIADAYAADADISNIAGQPLSIRKLFDENRKKFEKKFPNIIMATRSINFSLHSYALFSCGDQAAALPIINNYRDKEKLLRCVEKLWDGYFSAKSKTTSDDLDKRIIQIAMLYGLQFIARMSLHENRSHPNIYAAIMQARVYLCLLGSLLDEKTDTQLTMSDLDFQSLDTLQSNAATQPAMTNLKSQEKRLSLQIFNPPKHSLNKIKIIQHDVEKFAANIQVQPDLFQLYLETARTAINQLKDETDKESLKLILTGLSPNINPPTASSSASPATTTETASVQQANLSKISLAFLNELKDKDKANITEKTKCAVSYFLNLNVNFGEKIKVLTQQCLLGRVLSEKSSFVKQAKATPEVFIVLLGDAYVSQYPKLTTTLIKLVDPKKICSAFTWSKLTDNYLAFMSDCYKTAAFFYGNQIATKHLLSCYNHSLIPGGMTAYVTALVENYYAASPVTTPETETKVKEAMLYGMELAATQKETGSPEHIYAIRMAKVYFCYFCHTHEFTNDIDAKRFLKEINTPAFRPIRDKVLASLPHSSMKWHFNEWIAELPKPASVAAVQNSSASEAAEPHSQKTDESKSQSAQARLALVMR